MALEKAPYWTDLYYKVIEAYYWRPQAIGRKRDPEIPSYGWKYWKDKLSIKEIPLNHILDLLFHIAPDELLDLIAREVLKRSISGLGLVEPSRGTINYHIVQPDVILTNGSSLIFIEMKVDSKSSIDQFVKYAIAAHWITRDESQISSVDLVVLSRHTDHKQVWRNAKRLGLSGPDAVRKIALSGIYHDQTVWKEKGVPSFMKKNPDDVDSVAGQVRSMGLHLANYDMLEGVLRAYAVHERTVGHLIDGVLHEFERRKLTG